MNVIPTGHNHVTSGDDDADGGGQIIIQFFATLDSNYLLAAEATSKDNSVFGATFDDNRKGDMLTPFLSVGLG